ncbi:glycosyltransferase family 2 protein [Azospirillum sp.]|uniref:glycosyltransferase family 2 protein n=1 Tax=Azospirillum sp. TaxID=34012 RepID=UPI002D42BDF2|nr:glycosyltransferase family 2 protein [Azospirillum sp.]HYD71243.1 glycosyltransferase family 2 protein [Azospirillum sp.]
MAIWASVVIPTKNGGALFRRVLDGVRAQSTPAPFEVVVVDSGSTDGTAEACEGLDGVRLHRIPPQDFGHGRTRNLGISLARGNYVALITQDALPADGRWLAELLAPFDTDPTIAGVFGRHAAHAGADPFTRRDLDAFFDGLAAGPAVVRVDDPARWRRDAVWRRKLAYFSNNNSALRRSVWERIPFPDVEFAEDQAWARKALEAGYATAYADRALVFHSHAYGFSERLTRCFDEAAALRALDGRKLCRSPLHFLTGLGGRIVLDQLYALRSGLYARDPRAALARPADTLARQTGYLLGSHAAWLPARWRRGLSREAMLKGV